MAVQRMRPNICPVNSAKMQHVIPDLIGNELKTVPEKGGFAFIGELRVPLRVGNVGSFAGEQVFGIVHLEGIFQKR